MDSYRARHRGFWSGIAVALGATGIAAAVVLAIAGVDTEAAILACIALLAAAYWALKRASRTSGV
jgi:threonine/homoserine/homoserine lactone efflux protein